MKILLIVIVVFLIYFFVFRKKNNSTELEISTSTQSNERADKVLSLEGKEDVSSLLEIKNANLENDGEETEKEYFANQTYDWIITIEANKNDNFERTELDNLFSNEWRKSVNYPTIYCIPKNSNNWTYFQAGDNNENQFKKIALSWKLYDATEEPPLVFNDELLEDINEKVNTQIKKIKFKSVEYNYTTNEASNKSNSLAKFIQENNQWSIIVLKADKKFKGKKIWDVMMSIGLKWGDMDLFHWNNSDLNIGDDYFLSVWTSTQPGYFLPEEIAKGNVKTNDLIFGFSIPRSLSPNEVFEVMLKISEYAQNRLGGTFVDLNGNAFDKEKEKDKIKKIIENLEMEKIKTGIGDAMYLFQ